MSNLKCFGVMLILALGSFATRVVDSAENPVVTPGQTFYEGPGEVHTVGRNASRTEPAKFLVLLLKNEGVEPVLPAKYLGLSNTVVSH